MRKFVLIFAAIAGDALVELEAESRRRPVPDFPVVVSASGREEAEQMAARIATISGCQLVNVVDLPAPAPSRGPDASRSNRPNA